MQFPNTFTLLTALMAVVSAQQDETSVSNLLTSCTSPTFIRTAVTFGSTCYNVAFGAISPNYIVNASCAIHVYNAAGCAGPSTAYRVTTLPNGTNGCNNTVGAESLRVLC